MTDHSAPSTVQRQRFRVLITGSRTWRDVTSVTTALTALFAGHGAALVIVHGDCLRGVDAIVDTWCRHLGIIVERFPADWPRHGRTAGLIRNAAMVATRPDLCLAFIHNQSPGATHCAHAAQDAGILTLVFQGWGIQ